MHNILALSAVHNAHVRPNDKLLYRRLAAHHQCEAANGFRVAVQNISLENSTAVCTSAGITILSELGLFHQSQGEDPIHELLIKFNLIRSVIPLWQSSLHLLLTNRDSLILLKRDENEVDDAIPGDATMALMKLEELVRTLSATEQDKKVYRHAVKLLSWDFSLIFAQSRDFAQALRWGDMVNERYIELVKRKEPMALIILAHYCVLLFHATEQWCFEGWAGKVFQAIRASLEDPWPQSLDWAAAAMKIQPKLESGTGSWNSKVSAVEEVQVVDDELIPLTDMGFIKSGHDGLALGQDLHDLTNYHTFSYLTDLHDMTGTISTENYSPVNLA